jgi:hypothetical protein
MIKNKDFVREKLERGCCSRYVSDWWAASTWNPIFVHGLSHRQFESWMDEHYCFISHPDWGLTNKWSGLPFSRWYFYIQRILWRWPYVGRIKQKISLRILPQIINYLQIVVSRLNEWMNECPCSFEWLHLWILAFGLFGVCSQPESFHPTHHDPQKQLIVNPKIQLKHCFSCLSLETFD